MRHAGDRKFEKWVEIRRAKFAKCKLGSGTFSSGTTDGPLSPGSGGPWGAHYAEPPDQGLMGRAHGPAYTPKPLPSFSCQFLSNTIPTPIKNHRARQVGVQLEKCVSGMRFRPRPAGLLWEKPAGLAQVYWAGCQDVVVRAGAQELKPTGDGCGQTPHTKQLQSCIFLVSAEWQEVLRTLGAEPDLVALTFLPEHAPE